MSEVFAAWQERLANALLDSIGIGIGIATISAVVSRTLFSQAAAARAWCHSLGLIAVGMLVPFLMITSSRQEGAVPSMAASAGSPSPGQLPQNGPRPAAHSLAESERGLVASQTLQAAASVAGERALWERWIDRLDHQWRASSGLVAMLYVLGLGLMTIRLGVSLAEARRLRRTAIPLSDLLINSLVTEGLAQLRLTVRPTVRRSAFVAVPVVSGFLRPVILLPEQVLSQLNVELMRSLLLHELAHLKRHDPWWLVVQLLAETVAFYHPAVWWLSRELSEDREQACDDLVLAAGTSRKSYAEALLSAAEIGCRGIRGGNVAAQLGAVSGNSALRRRLYRILDVPLRARRTHSAGVAAAIMFLAAGATIAWSWNGSIGQSPEEVEPLHRPNSSSSVPLPQPVGLPADRLPMQLVQAGGQALPKGLSALGHVDDSAESKRSIAASGHAVKFERQAEATYVEAIQIFAARYGTAAPPRDDFHVQILNEKQEVLADLKFPYSTIARGDLKWYMLRTPSIEVPEVFYVALAFNPHETKGISLGLDESMMESHSYTGLVGESFESWKDKGNWMVRAHLSEKPIGTRGVQKLADWKPPTPAGDPFDGAIEVKYDGDKSAGKKSYGGAGVMVAIPWGEVGPEGTDRDKLKFKGLRLYGSRYGSGFDPEMTGFFLRITDQDGKSQWELAVPYNKLTYEAKWIDIPLPEPVEVAPWVVNGALNLGVDPEATQRKGIYFHYSTPADNAQNHSRMFVPGKSIREVEGQTWMIRAYFSAE